MIRTDFHANQPTDSVRAHVTGGTAFISASRGNTTVTLFIPIEKAREVAAAIALGLAEHDLIAKAKAEAKAMAEAA